MIKAGILGGGQLGKMLLQAGANYPVEIFVMEKDADCPSASFCSNFTPGDITNADDVYNFGKNLDVLTIEIENVNVEALESLESAGVKVFPTPAALRIIRDKIKQKEFYAANEIPSPHFVVTGSAEELTAHQSFLPAVHKLATGGYDGRGVQILNEVADFSKAFDAPAVLEKKVKIEKELAVIVATNAKGETAIYEPVDMVMDPDLNMLSHQLSPANIPEKILWKAEAIALRVVKALKSPGIFAIELFTDKEGNVWVNETAPRVHNSGHHSIEACYSSQFDMLWRVMLSMPLGNSDHILNAALVNIVGAKGYNGVAVYRGLNEVLAMDNVFVHIYGKKQTSPGRKMGHVTVLSNEPQELLHKVGQIKQLLRRGKLTLIRFWHSLRL